MTTSSSRLARIGVALGMLATGTLIGVASQHFASAVQDSGVKPVLIPINGCRLVDTRQPVPTPLTAGETRIFDAHGTNGACTLPTDALGVSMNITALDATNVTFFTIWETGQPKPNASSLNPAPGQPPTPNAVTTPISPSGQFNISNDAGTVGVLIDIVGYYVDHNHDDRYDTSAEVDAKIAANPGGVQSFAKSAVVDAPTVDLTTTPTSYVSVTLTAPAAGHVTLNSTAHVRNTVTDGADIHCAIVLAAAIPPSDLFDTESVQVFERGGAGENGNLSGTRTFEIANGATVEYALACDKSNEVGGEILVRNITAIYTPAPPAP